MKIDALVAGKVLTFGTKKVEAEEEVEAPAEEAAAQATETEAAAE